ncbi:MAG: ZIP family metal transporter, partial [Thermoproteota archaeon]|nr:ZIP family metal transporter [Thermoproteota archaeon]
MSNTFWPPAIASFLACVVTTIGIYVISKYRKWGEKHVAYFMCFAAGVIISVSFLHIIPKSFKMSENVNPILTPMFLLIGFLLLRVFSELMKGVSSTEKRVIGIIPTVGIGLHSFVDGIIYSVTFTVSIFTGILATTGMVLHEFPEGIVTFLFLIEGGFEKKKSLLYAFLAAAISTPLGMLVSYPFISSLKKPVLGMLLALSAGALIYVG